MIDLSKIPNIIKNNPASDHEIQEIEHTIKGQLPDAYKYLLKYTNGFSIGGGLVIYGTDDIVERNETWEVGKYASGYISIGDDGGGNVFLMLQEAGTKEVLIVGTGDMNPHNAIIITSDFSKWIKNGCLDAQVQKVTVDSSDTCSIVLIKAPSGGLKELVKIKSLLGIDISTAELLKGSKNPPFVLAKKFPHGKAKKLITKLGPIGTAVNVIPTNN